MFYLIKINRNVKIILLNQDHISFLYMRVQLYPSFKLEPDRVKNKAFIFIKTFIICALIYGLTTYWFKGKNWILQILITSLLISIWKTFNTNLNPKDHG